jgi:hypothetical protein
MSMGEAYTALHDLSEADRITVATTELAGILFEHDSAEVEPLLAAIVLAIRKHHATLVEGWTREGDERTRIADAAKEGRAAGHTPLRVVTPESEDKR